MVVGSQYVFDVNLVSPVMAGQSGNAVTDNSISFTRLDQVVFVTDSAGTKTVLDSSLSSSTGLAGNNYVKTGVSWIPTKAGSYKIVGLIAKQVVTATYNSVTNSWTYSTPSTPEVVTSESKDVTVIDRAGVAQPSIQGFDFSAFWNSLLNWIKGLFGAK